MGRGGPGLLDSDMFWDDASDLGHSIGIDLAHAGDLDMYDDYEEDEERLELYTIEETRKEMNSGRFDYWFGIFAYDLDSPYELCMLVILCMKLGVCIQKKQLDYVKNLITDPVVYEARHLWEMLPECRHQLKLACEEYECGEPYEFFPFDYEEKPWENPDSPEYHPDWRAKSKAYHDEQEKAWKRMRAEAAAAKKPRKFKKARKGVDNKHGEKGASDSSTKPASKKAKA